jgi:hypothetical protein
LLQEIQDANSFALLIAASRSQLASEKIRPCRNKRIQAWVFSVPAAGTGGGLLIQFCYLAKKRSPINSGNAFFDEIALNFPIPQRRKEQAVDWFNGDRFGFIC